MANSIITTDGTNGFGPYTLNFTLGILKRTYVSCRVNDEVDGGGDPVYRDITWITDGLINIGSGTEPTVLDTVVFTRTIPIDVLIHDYSNGAAILEANLDESNLQTIMIAHQYLDGRLTATLQNDLDMGDYKIINLADGTDDQDAATIKQINDIVLGTYLLDTAHIDYDPALLVGTPTHITDLQRSIDHIWSAGIVDGGALTDNSDGTIDIAITEALLRATASSHESLHLVRTTTAQIGITLTDDATNYVYLDWNSGVPQFAVTTTETDVDQYTKVIAYIIHRNGNILKYLDMRDVTIDSIHRSNHLFRDFSRFIHKAGGAVLGEPANLAVSVTEGEFYHQTLEIIHPAFDTNIAGTANENVFRLWYRDGASGWTATADEKVIDVTIYDGDTGTPVVLSNNNKYGVTWFYMMNDTPSELHAVMGQAEYNSQAEAEAASPPTGLPSILSGFGVLIGFVVYHKIATSFDNILSSFTQSFTPSQAVSHNNLAGLNLDDYVHLTAAEYAALGAPSFGGATQTTSAVDITLDVDDTVVQEITMTVADKAVILPDATTLVEGSELFKIANTGDVDFEIKNNTDGSTLALLKPTQVCSISLVDNAAVQGVWLFGDESIGSEMVTLILSGEATSTITANQANSYPLLTARYISDGKILLVYGQNNVPNSIFGAKILTVATDGTVSAGAEVTFYPGAYDSIGTVSDVVILSTTQALFLYKNNTDSSTECQLLDLNTSTNVVTPQNYIMIDTDSGTGVFVKRIDDTTAIAAFRTNAGTYTGCAVLSVSGSTVSKGSTTTVIGTSSGYSPNILETETVGTYLLVAMTSSTTMKWREFSVSGTTVTALGSEKTETVAGITSLGVYKLDATKHAFFFNSTSAGANFAMVVMDYLPVNQYTFNELDERAYPLLPSNHTSIITGNNTDGEPVPRQVVQFNKNEFVFIYMNTSAKYAHCAHVAIEDNIPTVKQIELAFPNADASSTPPQYPYVISKVDDNRFLMIETEYTSRYLRFNVITKVRKR